MRTAMTIQVPARAATPLIKALHGPDSWAGVLKDPIFFEPPAPSSHQAMILHERMRTESADLQHRFRTQLDDYPDVMPIAYTDAYTWMVDGERSYSTSTETYLSFSKLVPLTQAMVARYFPGTIDAHGWWHPNPQDQLAYDNGTLGWEALTQAVFGVPELPFVYVPNPRTLTPCNTTAILGFGFQSPHQPLQNLHPLLTPILATYGAKALMVSLNTWDSAYVSAIDPKRPPQEWKVSVDLPHPLSSAQGQQAAGPGQRFYKNTLLTAIHARLGDPDWVGSSFGANTLLPTP